MNERGEYSSIKLKTAHPPAHQARGLPIAISYLVRYLLTMKLVRLGNGVPEARRPSSDRGESESLGEPRGRRARQPRGSEEAGAPALRFE